MNFLLVLSAAVIASTASAVGTDERAVQQPSGIGLAGSEGRHGEPACPRPTLRRIRTFDDRDIESVIAEVAAKTGKWIAVAPQLLLNQLSFSVAESEAPEEFFREFIAALQSLGYRTIETGDVATILPGNATVPTPLEHEMNVDFEGADIRAIAKFLGPETGRIIAVAWPICLRRKLDFRAGPGSPEELYKRFVEMVEGLGCKAVVAGQVVTIVPTEALR